MELPKAKSNVPDRSSQGIKCRKVCCGVLSNSMAPAQPPATLVTSRGTSSRAGAFSRLMYAAELAARPGHKATVLVAFAGTAGTPRKSNAGNDIKLPPPATALRVPAMTAAKNNRMA